MILSEHFTMEEATFSSTASRLGIDNIPDGGQNMNIIEAAEHLEKVRALLGKPLHIDSWMRVPRLNQAVGGAANSAHMSGWAIDFTCPEYGSALDIVNAIVHSGIKFDQCIEEGTWVHISFAPTMRQQVLTAHFENGKKTVYSLGIQESLTT